MQLLSLANFRAKSDRLDVIESLREFGVKIDVYGKCQPTKIWPEDNPSKIDLISRYKFTLAFENVVSQDYVSEKFADPLSAGSVPVYLGSGSAILFAPTNASFISLSSFENLRALSRHLLWLASHNDEYEKLLEWKKQLPSKGFMRFLNAMHEMHPMCQLCHTVRHVLQNRANEQ